METSESWVWRAVEQKRHGLCAACMHAYEIYLISECKNHVEKERYMRKWIKDYFQKKEKKTIEKMANMLQCMQPFFRGRADYSQFFDGGDAPIRTELTREKE